MTLMYSDYEGYVMGYVNPAEVKSPKWAVKSIRVLEDLGEERYSIARLKYDGNEVLACRWNGNGVDEPHGHPNSRGKPTWFILPETIARDVLSGVVSRALLGSEKIKKEILRIKEECVLFSDSSIGTMIETMTIGSDMTVIDANVLVDAIRLDDDFRRKKVFAFDTDADGYKSLNPIKEINGKLTITLYREQ